MGRSVLRLTVLCALLLGGLSSGLVAATGRGGAVTTTAPATVASVGPTALTPVPTATTTTDTAAEVIAISGHGWGHGLGLSQWGAYGYAKHGWTYDRILAHYYSGTTLGQASLSTVRVQLVDARSATLSSSVAWSVVDAAGTAVSLAAGSAVVLTSSLTVGADKLSPPLVFSSTQPLVVGGHAYRGRLVVTPDGKKVQVVDTLALEAYLKGVVAAEMPSTWPAEALKAQAVAARSYALANLQKGASFDLYGDSRSQEYGGVAAESPATDAAVDATKGQVVLYAGKVADTLFFSTSGGRTASAAVATGQAVPYLVSVADPYDTASPYHDWGPVLVDATRAAKLMKLPGTVQGKQAPQDTQAVQGMQATLGSDGRVQTMTITGAYGTQAKVPGAQVRLDLDLRSTWFSPTLLSLSRPVKTMTYGGATPLSGFVRAAAGVNTATVAAGGPVDLESRAGTGSWQAVAQPALATDGSFSLVVRPQVTTQYRLSWGTVRAGLTKVSVAPLVTAAFAAGSATGSIRPVVAGATVELQWSPDGSTWQTVGQSTTDGTGAFSVAGSATATSTAGAGSYRVRVTPGHGLVPGYSATG